ncbi:hypothetical protein ACTJJR_01825 [Bacillus sp. 22266]|uniref:hypothetical protein n=1 Tax=Bacillus TaxID=1386 RepID=UPI0039898168
MAKEIVNANAKIHVLSDETLGGIKREYVEVDRKLEMGDTVLVMKMDGKDTHQIATIADDDYGGDFSYVTVQLDRSINGEDLVDMSHRSEDEIVLIEPTDIVHIDGQRYEMVEREAEVGEKVIHLYEGESNGIAREVRKTDDEGVEVDPYEDEEGVWIGFSHGYYLVLVPVEAAEDEPKPADPIDVIASLAQEVAEMKRKVSDQQRMLDVLQRRQVLDNIQSLKREQARHRDEIDTLFKDKRTLGEELARLKNPVESESTIESAPFVLVIHEGRGEFDVYRRGKKIENISRLEIEADSRIGSSIDLEFNNVGVRP